MLPDGRTEINGKVVNLDFRLPLLVRWKNFSRAMDNHTSWMSLLLPRAQALTPEETELDGMAALFQEAGKYRAFIESAFPAVLNQFATGLEEQQKKLFRSKKKCEALETKSPSRLRPEEAKSGTQEAAQNKKIKGGHGSIRRGILYLGKGCRGFQKPEGDRIWKIDPAIRKTGLRSGELLETRI